MIKYSLLAQRTLLFFVLQFCLFGFGVHAQTNQPGTNGIQTYVNPILPGDHPDQTIWKQGNDFYTTGSNFHFAPYLPILHSTDLLHWKVISRAIPTSSSIPSNDATQAGTWQGSIVFFNNKFWVYFSNNAGGGQYFCTATNPAGPWSAPVKVNTNTGVYGYDNSVFVDDDGTPYMLLKNGQANNGLQKLNPATGQPDGQALNMNWVNANNIYSWAEGPVMCKRNGRYYMFVAGNVTGGQYVLSSAKLSNVESDWTRHGNFWTSTTSAGGFTGPNHVTNPVMLSDGTWWCLSHAYDNDGWGGQGRQSHLHRVNWDANGVPRGVPVSVNPVSGPNLANTPGYIYDFGKADYFESTTLKQDWHVFNKANYGKFSLSEKPGYLRLKAGTGTTHVLQKDKGKYYSLTTKVDFNATTNGQQAGIRLTNGADAGYFNLYSGYNNGKKIGFFYGTNTTEINNTIGNVVWLRVERAAHILTCFYSADGLSWTQLGATTDVSALDKSQENYNEWVGTSVGLYATKATADFDLYSYRYGFVPIKVEGRNNWFGVTFANKTPGRTLTNSTSGDWLMLAGVDFGSGDQTTGGMELHVASSNSTSSVEIWLDNIEGNGTKVATVAIPNTGGTDTWKNVTAAFTASGQHDVYLRYVGGANAFFVNTIKCLPNSGPVVSFISPTSDMNYIQGQAISLSASAISSKSTISNVKFYDGNTLLSTVTSSPYTFNWTNASVGTHTLKAVATDNGGKTVESTITIKVNVPQGPYNGTWNVIPGTIQFENFDVGGNGFAYSDASAGNTGGATFRTDEDVDIENCTDAGTGYNIGFATAGEWLEYSVDVQKPGTYDIDFRVACNADARTLSLSLDGVVLTKDLAIPNTAGWQTWTTVSVKNVSLKAGKQLLRLTIGASDYINLNYVTFKLVKELIQEPFNNTAHVIPGKIEAEEYDLGGEGLAYHEGDTLGNQGGATFRTDGVDIENCTDAGLGYNIGYGLKDEWLEYSVHVSNTGNYDVSLRVAKDGTGGLMHIEFDGVDVTGAITIPNTAGWQMWQTVTLPNIKLTAGAHIMKLVFDANYTNINYVEFKDVVTGENIAFENEFSVYPNPFTNHVQINQSGAFNYKVTTLSGSELMSGTANDQLELGADLNGGVYILSIENAIGILNYKIIKQ